MDTEVIVIGAGLAGLTCATALHRRGIPVRVLDQDTAPGGRVQTDVVDGFRCDRGFQLINPAYPMVKEFLDVPALELVAFGTGVLVRTESGLTPLHLNPAAAVSAIRQGLASPAAVARFAAWATPGITSPAALPNHPDTSLARSLDTAKITGTFRDSVLEPFLAGVLADNSMSESANFTKYLVGMFVKGKPSVPAHGMGAVPAQLATALGDAIQLNTSVERIDYTTDGATVHTTDGPITGQKVVLATGSAAAHDLTQRSIVPHKSLCTWWFTTPQAPHSHTFLAVDGTASAGPITNTAVVSNVAPSYAPAGHHLIQATSVIDHVDATPAALPEVKKHLERIYGCDTSQWQLVTQHHIRHALPQLKAPWRLRNTYRTSHAEWVIGDYTTAGSIQHAMSSGAQAALDISTAH